jgi:hypothetical protein
MDLSRGLGDVYKRQEFFWAAFQVLHLVELLLSVGELQALTPR